MEDADFIGSGDNRPVVNYYTDLANNVTFGFWTLLKLFILSLGKKYVETSTSVHNEGTEKKSFEINNKEISRIIRINLQLIKRSIER